MQYSESASGVFGLKIASDKLVERKMFLLHISCLFHATPRYRICNTVFSCPVSYKQFLSFMRQFNLIICYNAFALTVLNHAVVEVAGEFFWRFGFKVYSLPLL